MESIVHRYLHRYAHLLLPSAISLCPNGNHKRPRELLEASKGAINRILDATPPFGHDRLLVPTAVVGAEVCSAALV